tara:strand:+ start:106 stop:315 length:210 start_codon:yes stop_codon:yes gene_type:complete
MFSFISRVIRFLVFLGYFISLIFAVQTVDNWLNPHESKSLLDFLGLIIGIIICFFITFKIVRFFLQNYF